MERRDPLQLSLDFGVAEQGAAPQQATPLPEVVCLQSYRKERVGTSLSATDSSLFYQRILDSIRHFA